MDSTLRASLRRTLCAVVVTAIAACGGGSDPSWAVVTDAQPGALLSLWGTSENDVWVVGADARDGKGPLVLHVVDGVPQRVETGEVEGDLWWVHGFAGGPVFMGGSRGLILRYAGGAFTKLTTPGNATVFGMWGSTPTNMWAVGGTSDAGGGFAWRLSGDTWTDEPALPADVATTGALWKVHGVGANDAWLVGSNGLSFHWDGQTLTPGDTGVGSSLFTVFGTARRYAAVGGLASGIILENDGSGWVDTTPDPLPEGLTGVALDDNDGGVAVGSYGAVYERSGDGWTYSPLGFQLNENLHGVWMDPQGGVWAAGGNTLVAPLTAGVLLHRAAADK